MAGKQFSKEELNFLKFASLVLDEFPKALREIFTSMWNNKFAHTYQLWDDSATVRGIFQTIEVAGSKIPFNDSFQQWDCTALFQATIHAMAFALTDHKGNKKTLNAMYLKKTKLPHGSFHTSVNSPSGDQNETLALVLDQLRLLRNTLCHSKESKLNKATFDHSVKLAKNAFAAAKVNTASIDDIGNLAEEDFPTSKVTELKECFQKELKSNNYFLQEKVCVALDDLNEHTEAMGNEFKTELSDVKKDIQELSKTTSMIQEELVRIRSEPTQMTENEIEKEHEDTCSISEIANLSPRSYLPPLLPHFTGRSSECKYVIAKLCSESTRLLNIFGSPGFGKTSTAIAAGHVLQAQGHSVYFSNFQGVKSKHDFISKILSLFWRATTSNVNVNLAPTDELCCIFREISYRVFIILDDLDNVLACSSGSAGITSVKDEVMHFIEEILCRCQNVSFLTTARQSLEFMSLKIEGCQSIRIEPLDQNSCESLIRKLLPFVASDVLIKVTRICGRVPLAIKLFCSAIDELSLASSLDSFFESSRSVGILDLLDKPDYPSDSRLKVLFESSFNRLSGPERESFSVLFMFDGYDFDMDAAAAIIGGDKVVARQNLTSLVRKSLVDKSAKDERFSLHPLLHSFAIEKGGVKPEEDILLLRTMLYKHYLSLFQTLNEQFLSGAAMKAFAMFYKEERFIWLSFHVGFQTEVLCAQMFDILATAEMFLNAICLRDRDSLDLLYDLASRKVLEQGNDVSYHRIAVSRFCRRNIFNLGRTDDNVGNQEKAYLLPDGMGAKCMCYQGINALSNGLTEPGVQLSENGISNLNNSPDQRFLKLLTSQLLALHYKFSKNVRKSEQFSQIALSMCQDIGDSSLFVISEIEQRNPGDDAMTSLNMPLVIWVCSLLSMWAREYLSVDMKMKLNIIVSEIQTQVLKTTRCCQSTLVSLLHIGDLALFFLNPDEPSRIDDETIMVNTAVDQGNASSVNKNEDVKPKEAKTDAQKIKKERLTTWYFRKAQYHFFKEEYYLAAQLHQRVLDWRLELYGEQHMKTAESYQLLGSALSKIGEFTSALHQFQCALNIRLLLFGEKNGKTADARQSIGILQHKIGEHAQALESHRRALDTRLHLYGKNSAKVLKCHLFIGDTEEAIKDYTSALKSYRNALEIGLELYGENHVKTAEIYLLIGNIQINMRDYSSALQSYNCALSIRLKMYRVPRVLTGYLYKTIGILQHTLGDFKSALHSKQSALKEISQLFGEQDATVDIHQSIARTYNSMENYDSALDALKRVLEIKLKLYGDNVMVADCHCHIGFVQRNKGDLDSAVKSHQRELDIRLKLSSKIDPKTADSYQHIASAQNLAGNYQSAVELFQRALDIRQKVYGVQHPLVACTYRYIGIVMCNNKDFQLALYNFQQALDIRLIIFGKEHAKTAKSDRDVLDTKEIIEERKRKSSCVIN